MFDLHGRKALITGSSQGIGRELALCLAAQGAEVFVHGSASPEKVGKVVDAIRAAGNTAGGAVADLSQPDCAETLYRQTGDVDILVLNASYQVRKSWDEITAEEFDRQLHINLWASLRIIQLYAPAMKAKRWGRIVTVGSVQQYKPHPQMAMYAASKAGQLNLVHNLSKQLSPFGITVNNMAPGTILTPRNAAVLENPEYRKAVELAIPCGYIGDAKDCNGAVVLLCSEEGRYINGVDLPCDGGMHL